MELEEYIEELKNEVDERIRYDQKNLYEAVVLLKDRGMKPFTEGMRKLYRECLELQKAGKKAPVKALALHPLRASIRAEAYEYKVALYDEELYFDQEEVSFYWGLPGFEKVAEESGEYFRKVIQKKWIRVPDYEIKEFCEWYLFVLMQKIPDYVVEGIEESQEMTEFQEMEKNKDYSVYHSEYRFPLKKMKIEME